jgi:hypothetical protein
MSIYDKASLVLIPSGTKTSKVYSQKPVNGDGDFTFSRSTAATRVNADGNIEKETQNLALQSNSFNTSPWSLQSSASLTSGQAGYDGSSNAWLLSKGADYSRLEQTISQSGVWTFSCYAKAGTLNWISFENSGIAGDTTFFDLANGTLGTLGSGCIDSSIEDIGSGWYRCSVTISGTSAIMRIQPSVSNGVANGSNGNIYIQDAQLEQGLVARDYIETTTAAVEGGITDNVPRLDYTDSSCPALLLEPQRTNLVNYSEYYDLFDHNVTLTTNADTSPEGVDNASKIVVSSNSQPRIEKFNTWSNSTTYSMSAYVKADTGRYIGFGLYSPEMGNQWVRFDLTNETFTYSDTNWSNASIVDAGDDWYKISATITTDATNSSKSGFKLASMQSNSYNTGTIGDSFFVYGIQIEEGSYATSYIPTYGTSVTRNADSLTLTSMSNNITSGISAASLFVNYEYTLNSLNDAFCFGQNNNFYPAGRGYIYSTGNGFADSFGGGGFSITQGADTKTIWRLNTLSNTNIFQNGVKGATRTGDAWSKVDQITFRGAFGTIRLKEMILFNQALTDQEAVDLTTI